MHRLRCGLIYTDSFAQHLSSLAGRDGAASGKILALDYLRCGVGDKAGAAWWKMEWMPEHKAPEECRFTIGEVPVCLSRQSQRGLKHRCVDWRDGQVVVLS